MTNKAYKFRIYPNKSQQILFNKTFGRVRFAWNQWVENFNKPKGEEKIFKTAKQLRNEFPWMKEVSAAAVQQKQRDFQQFKKQFFNKKRKKKVNKPKFKSRKNKQSFRLSNQKFCIYQDINKIRLEKIGIVKIIIDRIISKDVKFLNCTIIKDKINDYFAFVLVDENIQFKPKTGKEIGIDVGLTSFATLSNGMKVDNPRYFSESQAKIKRIQQHLSRKKLGSNRFYKNVRRLAKAHRKIARQRSFFLHNLSTHIVNEFDVISIEELNIKDMLKNHRFAKSISDVSWSQFFKQLSYKCDWYGKELKKVDRFEPTSKICNVCGYKHEDMDLSIRQWICPCCLTKHDRDVNAAINILNKSKPAGVNAELQTWRERKTSKTEIFEAVPDETLKNKNSITTRARSFCITKLSKEVPLNLFIYYDKR